MAELRGFGLLVGGAFYEVAACARSLDPRRYPQLPETFMQGREGVYNGAKTEEGWREFFDPD